VIGPKGAEVERMTEELQYMTGRKVAISIIEIKNPDLDAQLVAESVAEQLKKRAAFRRVVKMRAEAAMAAGRQGRQDPDLRSPGRRGDEPHPRRASGLAPLSTLQANIDYGFAEAFTTYGAIGVKVWIYKGCTREEPSGRGRVQRGGRPARARGRRK
jgi:small subunit ribosomal protein S3